MKLLTILCSSDLAGVVEEVLERSGAEGFLTVPGAVGVKPSATPPHGSPPRWPAHMYIAPVTDPIAVTVLANLEGFAGRCEEEPCLRIIVTQAEEVR